MCSRFEFRLALTLSTVMGLLAGLASGYLIDRNSLPPAPEIPVYDPSVNPPAAGEIVLAIWPWATVQAIYVPQESEPPSWIQYDPLRPTNAQVELSSWFGEQPSRYTYPYVLPFNTNRQKVDFTYE